MESKARTNKANLGSETKQRVLEDSDSGSDKDYDAIKANNLGAAIENKGLMRKITILLYKFAF